MTRYDDIINLPHHVSATHTPMPVADRAAQFSPFAALIQLPSPAFYCQIGSTLFLLIRFKIGKYHLRMHMQLFPDLLEFLIQALFLILIQLNPVLCKSGCLVYRIFIACQRRKRREWS